LIIHICIEAFYFIKNRHFTFKITCK